MTLDEAIELNRDYCKKNNCHIDDYHFRLYVWLTELRDRRKFDDLSADKKTDDD